MKKGSFLNKKDKTMTKFLRGIMILINIFVVLALVLVKIGSVVSPNTALLPAYASLGLLPIIILNIAFIVFWIMLRKWWALLSLLALIIFSGIIKSAVPVNLTRTEADSTRTKITLLSYNTMNTGLMKKHRKDDPNPVVQYILDSDADIVCLQEFAVSENKRQFQSDDFERIFSKYPHKHVSFQLDKWRMNIGLATLSKYPIIEKRNVDYESVFNLSIYTDVVIGDDTIRIINNHLESNRITSMDMKQTAEMRNDFSSEKLAGITKYLSRKMSTAYKVRAKQVDEVANVISNSPYKVISCGDYNDVPASYAYTKVKGNLKDAFRETGRGLGWTYAHSYYRFRIDYIMYDKSFRSANYKRGNLKSSDHYPIQTDLYLSKSKNYETE